jgi:molybdate/tungstate transport system substrate-binding protein
MRAPRHRVIVPRLISVVVLCLTLMAAACSSSRAGTTSSGTSSGASSAKGPVDVLYAGSLLDVMEQRIGPQFSSVTGYSFTGFAGGSSALAAQVRGKVRRGDVFISASPSVNASLEDGRWASWYATFATSNLVLGYNARSRFASDLKTKPWYDVITARGFRLGRTDPATDPKGKLALEALTDTAKSRGLPALQALADTSSDVFPEETLVGRLQAGQLDAGFFYKSEAVTAGLPTAPLAGVALHASYTVTVLNHAKHPDAAKAFVSYLLGTAVQEVLTDNGFDVVIPPAFTGNDVPSSLRSIAATP